MKYLYYAVNYNTLCRALRYIDEVTGKENSTVLYVEMASSVPKTVCEDYNVISINGFGIEHLHGIKKNVFEIITVRNSWTTLASVLKQSKDEFVFIVFRDNEPEEATLIRNILRVYHKKAHVWIMEEGIGIYSQERSPIKSMIVKAAAYLLTGISLYALSSNPQGLNPAIEKIICFYPHSLKGKVNFAKVSVDEMVPVYTETFGKYFAKACLDNYQGDHYDFVFLTIPILDLPASRYDGTIQEYVERVSNIVTIAAKHGRVLVKLHPRDSVDYSCLEGKNIHVCSQKENRIPYECLAALYGYPQMISAFSSANINSGSHKCSFYVSDILNIKDGGSKLPANFYKDNNIIVCANLKEFEVQLMDSTKSEERICLEQ